MSKYGCWLYLFSKSVGRWCVSVDRNMNFLSQAPAWAHQTEYLLHNLYQDIFQDTCCLLCSVSRKHTLRSKTRSGWCWYPLSLSSDRRLFIGRCLCCYCWWAVTTSWSLLLPSRHRWWNWSEPYGARTPFVSLKEACRYVYQNNLDFSHLPLT